MTQHEIPVHLASFDGSGLSRCCNKPLAELRKTARVTDDDALVLCNERPEG